MSEQHNIQQNSNQTIGDLSSLVVLDNLTVGPIRVEKKRLVAPYTVKARDKEDRIDLIFHYDEDVFDPSEAASRNLAGMIAAQVAINYGMFCRNIIFKGTFDAIDQKFIYDMAQNTAREILVKKFLEPNPFLIGPAKSIPPIKRDKYAVCQFSYESDGIPDSPIPSGWKPEKNKINILSSGGKDSLLSYGLIQELGYETHPIFVNESGRHWYTALNGYRYLKQNSSFASRVWTNSDRVFNWMLRHFSFIRQDFNRLRADEYPIRLWTVAVFLFGILPLVRNRGIGRVIIGDEYDTTTRRSFKGIPHYDGLYDQSRYFDNALSRYFHKKGWNVEQFSILRPLSEMLILNILAKRYPELQKQQVSCHAAHIESGRVYPCGNCEKCRRIVGMLVALNADPRNCGYSEKQIEQCLSKIFERGIHQESAGARHLLYLLNQKGMNQKPGREHPEIMKIRIDTEKSPLNSIPMELRTPLLSIFKEHATGAVKMVDRKWIDFEPSRDKNFLKPFSFEAYD